MSIPRLSQGLVGGAIAALTFTVGTGVFAPLVAGANNPQTGNLSTSARATTCLPTTTPAPTPNPTVSFADADGIHVEGITQFDARDYNVEVCTAALGRSVNVRILLPSTYKPTGTTRYPVLYLYAGTGGLASDWVKGGNAEATTAGRPLITVMPDIDFNGDGGGWFTNWVDPTTALGPSKWETFHVGQLIPWIDANLRTVATRNGRAVAGLSQGGFGSFTYAARHPDMFVSAAAFSGAPDIDYNPVVAAGATAVIDYIALADDGVNPDALFGSRVTDELNWQGHDPADLATNLRGLSMSLFTATGVNGPLDPPGINPGGSGIESATHMSTMSFYQRLESLGIPSYLDDYVFGTHTFPYWARDFAQYIGPLMQTFAHPPRLPASTNYESIDPSWTQWGWTVSMNRPQPAFSSLIDAGAAGFTLWGTGFATVTTPAVYAPGSTATVTYSGPNGTGRFTETADSAGSLCLLPIPVGTPSLLGGPSLPARASITIAGIPRRNSHPKHPNR